MIKNRETPSAKGGLTKLLIGLGALTFSQCAQQTLPEKNAMLVEIDSNTIENRLTLNGGVAEERISQTYLLQRQGRHILVERRESSTILPQGNEPMSTSSYFFVPGYLLGISNSSYVVSPIHPTDVSWIEQQLSQYAALPVVFDTLVDTQ